MANSVRAITRFVPMSPRKVRLVVDTVRGLGAGRCVGSAQVHAQGGSRAGVQGYSLRDCQCEENQGWTRDDLYVSEIKADEGPRRQWRRFGARGRFKPIFKRSSHITVVLTERE